MAAKALTIPFNIVKIEEHQFATFEEFFQNGEQITQNFNYGFTADTEKAAIGVTLKYLLKREEIILLKMHITCWFQVEPNAFTDKLAMKSGIKIPKEFAKHLTMLTHGTARGILFVNTKTSVFNKIVLGLANVDSLFTEDIVLKNNKV